MYSVFARYHNRSGNRYSKHTYLDLFNENLVRSYADIPRKLSIFLKNISHMNHIDFNNLVNKHTLYLYFTNFSREETKKELLTIIASGGESKTSNVSPTNKYFRYCPKCVSDDYLKYGETFWRKDNQIQGVFYCLKHMEPLRDSDVLWQPRFKEKNIFEVASLENCPLDRPPATAIKKSSESILLQVAQECLKTANQNLLLSFDNIVDVYKYLLHREGYLKGKMVNHKELLMDFQNYFGEEILDILGAEFNGCKRSNWLSSIVKKHNQVFPPIKHVLLTLFLNENVDTLNHYKNKIISPFGEGPYPCFNPFSDHYQQMVINNAELGTSPVNKTEIGIFSCDCGFTYTKSDNINNFSIEQIKYIDPKWERQFERLYKETKKRNGGYEDNIDKLLHIKQKYLDYSNGKKRRVSYPLELIEDYREKWLEILKRNPQYSLERIKKQDMSTYAFLNRHDKNWLRENSPNINNVGFKKVDWEKRDNEMLNAVKKGTKILLDKEKPERITLYALGRVVEKLDLLKKDFLQKMPKTSEYINCVVESHEQFQLRRVEGVVKKLIESRKTLTESLVRREAGIAKGRSEAVDQKIAKYCNEYLDVNIVNRNL